MRDYGWIKFSTSNGGVRLREHMCAAAEKKRESERNLARCQTVNASLFIISVWRKAVLVGACTDSFSLMIFCHIHKGATVTQASVFIKKLFHLGLWRFSFIPAAVEMSHTVLVTAFIAQLMQPLKNLCIMEKQHFPFSWVCSLSHYVCTDSTYYQKSKLSTLTRKRFWEPWSCKII